MDFPRIVNSKQIDSTTQEESAQKVAQKPVSQSGLSGVQDKLQSAAQATNKFEEAIQQSEVTGDQQLTSEQQKLADKSVQTTTDPFNDSGQTSQDRLRSTVSNRNDASLFPDFGQRLDKAKQDLAAFLNPLYTEPESDAVKDAMRLLQGSDLNDLLNDYLSKRYQDFTDMTGVDVSGDPRGRLNDFFSNDGKAPEGSSAPSGKGQIEEGYGDFPLIRLFGGGKSKGTDDGEGVHITDANKDAQKNHPGVDKFVKETYVDGGPTSTRAWALGLDEDAKLHEWTSADGTRWKETSDGTQVGNSKDGTITVIKGDDKTVTHPDGSYEDYHDGKKTDSGGALKLVDQENYTGNIPQQMKNFMNYLLEQAKAAKPHTSGETELTDGGATGNIITGGPVETVGTKVLGTLADPGNPELSDGNRGGNLQGTTLSGRGGGNIDYGPDSDETGWSGPLHQDDPADIQFGKEAPVVENAVNSSKNEDTEEENQTSRLFEFLRRNIKTSDE